MQMGRRHSEREGKLNRPLNHLVWLLSERNGFEKDFFFTRRNFSNMNYLILGVRFGSATELVQRQNSEAQG